MTDSRLLTDVKGAEDCRLTAYKDSRGFWTAGYGHKLDQHMDWTGHTIGQSQADAWLEADLMTAETQARTLTEWLYLETVCRQNALIELVFNMGFGNWLDFHRTRIALRQHRWQDAHDGLLDSLWARQVQPHGFDEPGRATRLADYLLTGEYPDELPQALLA